MVKINCLNPISNVGLDLLNDNYEIVKDFADADAVLVRSASVHELELGKNLLAIARAGAGYNNIPTDKCAEQGIVVFNTPGANANGVKELVIAGMLIAARDVVGGVNWVKTVKDDQDVAKLVEKGKKAFAGTEIKGKKLGVIGLGAIGVLVANAASALGMTVYGCDPYLSVEHALNLSSEVIRVKSNEDIYRECDYISLHVPLMDATKKMVNKTAFDLMKNGVVVLNFARDLLVDDEALKDAIAAKKVAKYVTDFPNFATANMDGVIAIPHLGASTEESEDNCAFMAVKQIREYIENGNIINSVNYPNCDAGVCQSNARIAIMHKNVPSMISQFTTICAQANINILNMVGKSKGDYSYTVIDTDSVNDAIVDSLNNIDLVYKVRCIK